jgi:hypothetical protein
MRILMFCNAVLIIGMTFIAIMGSISESALAICLVIVLFFFQAFFEHYPSVFSSMQ